MPTVKSNSLPNCKGTLGLENHKFRDNVNGDTGVRVYAGGSPLGEIEWDAHDKTVAGAVVTYRFYQGGLTGQLMATAVLTYADNTICDLLSSEWTLP